MQQAPASTSGLGRGETVFCEADPVNPRRDGALFAAVASRKKVLLLKQSPGASR
jgi:hypothetical protein